MIQLVKITEDDYQHWLTDQIVAYAQDKIEAGAWSPVEALERSKHTYYQLLPDGPNSEDQYIYSIYDELPGRKVGVIWFANVDLHWRRVAYLYDFLVYEQYRQQGYGMQALAAVEVKVRELGLDTIDLHVFGFNTAARALYEKMGYKVTDVNMRKHLG